MSDGEFDLTTSKNKFARFYLFLWRLFDVPVTAFREKFVEPIQIRNKIVYYHHQFRRVPTIDECDIGDNLCMFEANRQLDRDRKVEDTILRILRDRKLDCYFFHHYVPDKVKYCQKEEEDYKTAETNWFAKYGDMGHRADALSTYMKQKHRMIWERRHGPVGSGKRTVLSEPSKH